MPDEIMHRVLAVHPLQKGTLDKLGKTLFRFVVPSAAQKRSNRRVPLRMQVSALPVARHVCVATVLVATCAPRPRGAETRARAITTRHWPTSVHSHSTLRRELRDEREALDKEAGGEEGSGLRNELQHSAATLCNTVQAGVEELGMSSQSKIESRPRSVPTLYAMLEFMD